MTNTHLARRTLARLAAVGALAALAALSAVPAQAAPSAARPCTPVVTNGVLPVWARAGFSEARPRSAQALGRAGEIDAILFANPLLSPPARTHTNKILWVSRRPYGPGATLWIAAQRMVGTRDVGAPVGRVVMGGPGPSIIDLPAAGCWRLSLHWAGRSDSVDLRYQAN